MKAKPNKWGLKVWAMAAKSGYICQTYISGDQTEFFTNNEMAQLFPMNRIDTSDQVVLNLLMKPKVVPGGTNVFSDNFLPFQLFW